MLNTIQITLNTANNSSISGPLYLINAENANAVLIQSSTTTTGNQHVIQKNTEMAEVLTNIPNGNVLFFSAVSSDKSEESTDPFLTLGLF